MPVSFVYPNHSWRVLWTKARQAASPPEGVKVGSLARPTAPVPTGGRRRRSCLGRPLRHKLLLWVSWAAGVLQGVEATTLIQVRKTTTLIQARRSHHTHRGEERRAAGVLQGVAITTLMQVRKEELLESYLALRLRLSYRREKSSAGVIPVVATTTLIQARKEVMLESYKALRSILSNKRGKPRLPHRWLKKSFCNITGRFDHDSDTGEERLNFYTGEEWWAVGHTGRYGQVSLTVAKKYAAGVIQGVITTTLMDEERLWRPHRWGTRDTGIIQGFATSTLLQVRK